ncbi:M48 family metallopeptidase [Algiphilus sp.]|uniref:M48 family metallopeptidase n=1 Tax=Algiphilus sp. TaxID=1872431 RepID=UPI001CA74E9F|nr:M48 family metallopeptidase [Algiphilus sp.]MBY8964972.1 M48 family metallopeptidase [Algiphilus acroporae]MCI5062120.1 M48 family metallopeptidase [Algiphilus sp.]MCI5102907.1 M48 family metallopeptidase [Algiphilus sp.]
MRTRIIAFLAAFIGSTLIAACATSPTGRTQLILVSSEEMQKMGAQAFAQMKEETPVARNTPAARYVECVSRALTQVIAPEQSWEVRTFESDAINAFALPGGKIGVYTGLIEVADDQHQLAAVVGHEIAHVLANHSAARVSNQLAAQLGASVLSSATGVSPQVIGMGAQVLLLMPYGRGDESEADVLGLRYMAEAGFDPSAAPALWVNMARAKKGNAPPEFLSTHPSDQSRIDNLRSRLDEVMPVYRQARAAGRTPNCRKP